jgi:hypothetical protein
MPSRCWLATSHLVEIVQENPSTPKTPAFVCVSSKIKVMLLLKKLASIKNPIVCLVNLTLLTVTKHFFVSDAYILSCNIFFDLNLNKILV